MGEISTSIDSTASRLEDIPNRFQYFNELDNKADVLNEQWHNLWENIFRSEVFLVIMFALSVKYIGLVFSSQNELYIVRFGLLSMFLTLLVCCRYWCFVKTEGIQSNNNFANTLETLICCFSIATIILSAVAFLSFCPQGTLFHYNTGHELAIMIQFYIVELLGILFTLGLVLPRIRNFMIKLWFNCGSDFVLFLLKYFDVIILPSLITGLYFVSSKLYATILTLLVGAILAKNISTHHSKLKEFIHIFFCNIIKYYDQLIIVLYAISIIVIAICGFYPRFEHYLVLLILIARKYQAITEWIIKVWFKLNKTPTYKFIAKLFFLTD